jgi:Tn3 transposase DDE domain
LKETDIRTEFCKHFHTTGHHENINPEILRKKLLLSLYEIGSNTGLKRMSSANTEFTESDLRYIRRRYIHADNVRGAIREVVNNILAARTFTYRLYKRN